MWDCEIETFPRSIWLSGQRRQCWQCKYRPGVTVTTSRLSHCGPISELNVGISRVGPHCGKLRGVGSTWLRNLAADRDLFSLWRQNYLILSFFAFYFDLVEASNISNFPIEFCPSGFSQCRLCWVGALCGDLYFPSLLGSSAWQCRLSEMIMNRKLWGKKIVTRIASSLLRTGDSREYHHEHRTAIT